VFSQVEAGISHEPPPQSPVFPRLRTGALPFCTSHPQARAQKGRSAALARRGHRGPARDRWHDHPPTAVRCNSSMGSGAPAAPLGLCFSQAPQPPVAVPSVPRPCNEVSIAGLQERWHQPRNRGAQPYGQVCCDASGPCCQTQGKRYEPYSSRRPCPAKGPASGLGYPTAGGSRASGRLHRPPEDQPGRFPVTAHCELGWVGTGAVPGRKGHAGRGRRPAATAPKASGPVTPKVSSNLG
jgi:hypothetical protein